MEFIYWFGDMHMHGGVREHSSFFPTRPPSRCRWFYLNALIVYILHSRVARKLCISACSLLTAPSIEHEHFSNKLSDYYLEILLRETKDWNRYYIIDVLCFPCLKWIKIKSRSGVVNTLFCRNISKSV